MRRIPLAIALIAIAALLAPLASWGGENLPVNVVGTTRSGASFRVAYRFVNDTGRDIALGKIRCSAYDVTGDQLVSRETPVDTAAGAVARGDITFRVPRARPGRAACHLRVIHWADASAAVPAAPGH